MVRAFACDLPDDLSPRRRASHVRRSHLFNSFPLVLPYLEPFMSKTMQDAPAQLESPALAADIRALDARVSRHYRCHPQYNELVKRNAYGQLVAVKARLAAAYGRIASRSLRARLAFTFGFETMTVGFTAWLIAHRRGLVGDARPKVATF